MIAFNLLSGVKLENKTSASLAILFTCDAAVQQMITGVSAILQAATKRLKHFAGVEAPRA